MRRNVYFLAVLRSSILELRISQLRAIVLSASTTGLKNATPEEKKKRVDGLVKAEKAHRRLEKDHRSSVKRNRSFKGYD